MKCGRSIFFYSVLVLIIMLLGSSELCAELLGSPYPKIQENFNQLLTTNACPSCDLRGVVMNRLNLSGANLESANLTGAQLNFVCLTVANLRNADLHGAWLIGADLSGADVAGTILEDTELAQVWSKKKKLKPTEVAQNQNASAPVPDLFADWRNTQKAASVNSRRSVDEVPVLEITARPNEAETLSFWHYLFDLKQIAKQRNPNICPVSNRVEQATTSQRRASEPLP